MVAGILCDGFAAAFSGLMVSMASPRCFGVLVIGVGALTVLIQSFLTRQAKLGEFYSLFALRGWT